jgi:FMN phosphatase YigB (HAD superfamily)
LTDTAAVERLIREAQAFIFDLDGTLYDIRWFALRLVLASPREASVILAERRTRKGLSGCDYGSPDAYFTEFFSRMSLIAKKPANTLRAWYFNRYIPRMCGILRSNYRPRPGAAELFVALTQQAFPFAVYSDYPQAAERLSALGLDPGRGKLYGPEHFGAQKPAARPFASIAADLKVPPDRTLVIGDKDGADGAGATAAGMGYIGIRSRTRQKAPYPSLGWTSFTVLCRKKFGLFGLSSSVSS